MRTTRFVHSSLGRFLKFFKLLIMEEKEDLWILVIYGIWVGICSLVVPIAVQTFVNTIGFGLLIQPIIVLTFIVFTFLTFSGAMRALQVSVAEILQQRLFSKIAMEMAMRIPRLDSKIFRENQGPELVNRFFDVTVIQKTTTLLILDGAVVVLQIIFGMLLLAFYHPFLLALNLIIIIFVSVFFVRLGNRAIESNIQESKSKHSVAVWLQELAKNYESFRSTQSRNFALKKADLLTTEYIVSAKNHFTYLFKQVVAAIVLQIAASVLLLGLGGWLVTQGQLTLGQLVASELIVSSVVSGIGKFGKYLESYYDLAGALDKIGYIFELPLERLGGESVSERSSEFPLIRVRDLQIFGQHESRQSPLNFDLSLGSKTAIVGLGGSGKTRFIRLLYGLEKPQAGRIEIEGLDYQYASLESIRSKVFYVSEIQLFDGTLLDNIRLSQSKAGIDIYEIQNVLRELGLEEPISALPQGLHTVISGGQYPLSTTQAQKIMIARAIVAKPKLILFDDIFDHLDPQSDPSWANFLIRKNNEFSVLFTSRKKEQIHFCDQVILLDGYRYPD